MIPRRAIMRYWFATAEEKATRETSCIQNQILNGNGFVIRPTNVIAIKKSIWGSLPFGTKPISMFINGELLKDLYSSTELLI